MAHRKLKGVPDNEGKSSSHDSSGSQSPRKKRISDLEIFVQLLQNRLRFHRDPMILEDLVRKNKIEEEHDEEEETVRLKQLQNFLECKKVKDKHVKTMMIKESMMVATTMVITMRSVVIMMKAQDSLQGLIFHNLKEECMLMTSWIGLIQWNMSLSIVTTPPPVFSGTT